jgi:hypothetical protein
MHPTFGGVVNMFALCRSGLAREGFPWLGIFAAKAALQRRRVFYRFHAGKWKRFRQQNRRNPAPDALRLSGSQGITPTR